MKKSTMLLALALSTGSIAAYADTGPGCGWGAMLFEGKDGLGPNVLAATTNGTLGNQTFGMTTGTAGCDGNKPVTTSAADKFLDSNMEKIAKEMSTGQGENLSTLASLMGISDSDKGHFYSVTQSRFSEIFSKADISSKEVLQSLKTVLKQDTVLAQYVG